MAAGKPDFIALDWNGTVVPFFGLGPYSGALETAASWREDGCLVFVVSRAGQGTVERDVQRTGLAHDGVFGCVDKGPVLKDLHARHGDGVFLGDHPSDFRAAAEAGIPFLQAGLEGQPLLEGADGCFRGWEEAALLVATLWGISEAPS